jgi:hypothetical protein
MWANGSLALSVIASAAVFGAPCGAVDSGSESATQDSVWLAYCSEPFGFELDYPAGWELIMAQRVPDSVAVWEARILEGEQVHKVTFLEATPVMWHGEFQVCIWSVPDPLSFEDWLAAHMPTDVSGGSLVQDVCDTMLGGCPAKWLSSFGFDHEQIDILCSQGGRLYELSFAGANPNDPDVVRHQQVYAAMVESFRFLE